jgi:hypothetical protein
MNFIRAPSRFMIVTTLCLAVLAGAGFERIAVRWTHLTQRAAIAVVSMLLLAEFSAYPFKGADYALPAPAVDQWLASQPKPFVVAEVPLPDPRNSGRFERFQTMTMLHSMAHWQKTVHGYSGFRAPFHDQLYLEMRRFPDEASIARLRETGVTYVVVHRELIEPGQWPAFEARLAQSGLPLRHEDPSGRVYEIK